MEFIPVKTRVLQPPKDDLFAVLDESLTDVQEGDVLLISSKVVAIGEGRCVSMDDADKQVLVKQEATVSIPRKYWGTPLTIAHHAFIGTAGIDESNADGHYVLLPKDPFQSAKDIYTYCKARFELKKLGIVITDSHSVPMRYGAIGVAIGFWGFRPLKSHVGEADLFGREMRIEKSNLADSLAAGASMVMGEVAEQQPVVIARDVPSLEFCEGNQKDTLFVPFAEDTFRVLYERFLS